MLNAENATQFQRNINAMPEEMAALKSVLSEANVIEETPDSKYHFGVEVIEGRKVLYVQKEEAFFQLDSMYNSEELLKKWKKGIDALYNSKYLMFGIGNGMFVRTLLQNTKKDVKIFIYEPTIQLLKFVLSEFDFMDILSSARVKIMCGEMEKGENDLYTLWANNLDYADVAGARLSEYLNYAKIFPEKYNYVFEIYNQVIESIISNRVVLQRFGEKFYENVFKNYPYFCNSKSISSLWAYMPHETTAIIVSSGPSLNKNIEELRQAKGKSLIIAADSAVSVLLKHGIMPDMFVCVDANKNPYHFTDERIKDIPLVGNLHTCSVAIVGHRAPCFFINDANPHIQKFFTEHHIVLPLLSSGGSVATDAMSFAESIGIEKFILVGQDLAYTDNKTHAEGSLRSTWNIDISPTSCYLEGADGEQILSSAEFKLYRDWFEREIALKPNLIVVNATEGGAKIHGAVASTLKEAITDYCVKEVNIEEIFQLTANLLNEDERNDFISYMDGMAIKLEEAREKIKQGVYDYDKMKQMVLEKSYHSAKFVKLFQKTKQVADYLESAPIMYYPECLVQERVGKFLENVYKLETDEQKELLEVIGKGASYLSMMKETVDNTRQDIVPKLNLAKLSFAELIQKSKGRFNDNDVQRKWETVHRYIDPNMDMEGYMEFVLFLDQIFELKEKNEYNKLLDTMYQHSIALKEDMIICQAIVLSFLYAGTNNRKYLETLERTICNNTFLHSRQRYYLWWYLKRNDAKIGIQLYQQVLEKYHDELKESLVPLKAEKRKEEVTVAILIRDYEQETENSLLEECLDLVRDAQKVIIILSGEYGAENGMLPLYGESVVPKKNPMPMAEIIYKQNTFTCIMPYKLMPNVEQYKEILHKLENYNIIKVLTEEGSVLGELLKRTVGTREE